MNEITSIYDAIDIVAKGCDGTKRVFPPPTEHLAELYQGHDNFNGYVDSRYKFPYGIWFRGHSKKCYHLRPSLFRKKTNDVFLCGKVHYEKCGPKLKMDEYYDETAMVYHFQHRMPNYGGRNYSLFDWLCLMQHYKLPTRLLDWTENILIALYFVVKDKEDDCCDGSIFALNAARLNETSSLFDRKRQLQDPNTLDVMIRSILAVVRTRDELIKVLKRNGLYDEIVAELKYGKIREWLRESDPEKLRDLMRDRANAEEIGRLGYPIAVYPNRIIERMALQHSVMTIYGGKDYDNTEKDGKEFLISLQDDENHSNKIPIFKSIYSLSEDVKDRKIRDYDGQVLEKHFLKEFKIPSDKKVKIREELKRIGFNDVSMFPEVEYQANYIKKQWKIDKEILEY